MVRSKINLNHWPTLLASIARKIKKEIMFLFFLLFLFFFFYEREVSLLPCFPGLE